MVSSELSKVFAVQCRLRITFQSDECMGIDSSFTNNDCSESRDAHIDNTYLRLMTPD